MDPARRAAGGGGNRRDPLRADAARIRNTLLAAAFELFAEQGSETSNAQVAARAGVAKGTVFGHFPHEALPAAVVSGEVDRLVTATGRLPKGGSPGAHTVRRRSLLPWSDHRRRRERHRE
ncbi:TetR/AcrR family transcriptional regulator [Actinacidiphila guanduensis]|uniref:Transcriptional regulator, TetR family n=1 Tax=Actinacidiphila guanduensis TaxID=310781 RepID=A0A1H0PY64_9ACTN|nr:TetR/AcrR family transcriptional regulator [Actinacidiphila guanduensis]SDP09428.1 transcriptional regulator, TetR family [Actinacidiphila guanduensis]